MSTASTPPPADNRAESVDGKNLDLLLDVNLALTLRFGQRDMTLREVLELSSGAVIELDRHVEEPADLLLGDRVIARGQVVIVDGNYGIKITELPA
ncbi:MAG: flagellar motor switch protein FliN [Terriglobales bacterium]